MRSPCHWMRQCSDHPNSHATLKPVPHNKPHENGVVLRTRTAHEMEGAWFHAATPEEARAMYRRLADGHEGGAVFDLVISGQIVESTEKT